MNRETSQKSERARGHALLESNPSLYQVNTRIWLTELSKQLNRPATLDDIPGQFFEWLVEKGFTWVYFLSVWQTGEIGKQISSTHAGLREGFLSDIPDLTDDDICGSGFAITDYVLNREFGHPDELIRLRKKLNDMGVRLMLDLVPNHTAIDHHWVDSNPEYFVTGTEEDVINAPQNFIRVKDRILAHGRDPYFDGWPDTLQLNYGEPALRKAMHDEIMRIAGVCDGLRCDMAMLILPDVFSSTWGIDIPDFWIDALNSVRRLHPDFVFMAEVYWGREWDLQQQGFDFTYDKRLYDRLRQNDPRLVREHLLADLDYQKKSARFLENHDEPRAAGTFFPEQHRAAAVLTFLVSGLRFFHQGQFEGLKKRASVHLRLRPQEARDSGTTKFYDDLLRVLKLPVVHQGSWHLLQCSRAWDSNWTADSFICFAWINESGQQVVSIVNYSEHQSQCRVNFVPGQEYQVLFVDERSELPPLIRSEDDGLFIDLAPWGYVVMKTAEDF